MSTYRYRLTLEIAHVELCSLTGVVDDLSIPKPMVRARRRSRSTEMAHVDL
jgi:hypothetical protein